MESESPGFAACDRGSDAWKTKPSDRFVLRWIKLHLSARVTPLLLGISWLRPAMITLSSALLGVWAGIVFGLGVGWLAGLLAAGSQVLDGVDGQFARLTGRASRGGAFLDSVLDRYTDGAMLMGMIVYLARRAGSGEQAWPILIGALALIGSGLISYTWARSDSLGFSLGERRTLISKGTRMTVMILAGLGSIFWGALPWVALIYIAVHTNLSVLRACLLARRRG